VSISLVLYSAWPRFLYIGGRLEGIRIILEVMQVNGNYVPNWNAHPDTSRPITAPRTSRNELRYPSDLTNTGNDIEPVPCHLQPEHEQLVHRDREEWPELRRR
jgi:hypothetical protein